MSDINGIGVGDVVMIRSSQGSPAREHVVVSVEDGKHGKIVVVKGGNLYTGLGECDFDARGDGPPLAWVKR